MPKEPCGGRICDATLKFSPVEFFEADCCDTGANIMCVYERKK